MIKSKADLKFYLQEDSRRNNVSTNFLKYYSHLICGSENYHIYRYIKCLRYCEFFYNTQHKILYYLYKIKLGRLGLKYNIRIPLNVCGYGLRIMHISGGGGVLLNAKKIGNYCGINSGVIIGNKGNENSKPLIGNNVAFAPGAKAFGDITIGDNVFVAPNAVVTKSFPCNSIIGGIPAKVLK